MSPSLSTVLLNFETPMTRKSTARTQLYTDKCTQCATYFATTNRADLIRRLSAHELDAHGTLDPDRPDHRALDER